VCISGKKTIENKEGMSLHEIMILSIVLLPWELSVLHTVLLTEETVLKFCYCKQVLEKDKMPTLQLIFLQFLSKPVTNLLTNIYLKPIQYYEYTHKSTHFYKPKMLALLKHHKASCYYL